MARVVVGWQVVSSKGGGEAVWQEERSDMWSSEAGISKVDSYLT